MTQPRDPHDGYDEPPAWTDPYADLFDLDGEEPIPPLEPPDVPVAVPPRSPMLTGLIIALLLVALTIAVFQLLKPAPDDAAASPTTAVEDDGEVATPTTDVTSTTDVSTTTAPGAPPSSPYVAVGEPIPVDRLKLIADGIRVNLNDVPDIIFGTADTEAIGRFVATFGEPTDDTGWQVSTGAWGVCQGDLERIVTFGPFAAIVTQRGGGNVFDGYRLDLTFGGSVDHPAAKMETRSGLRAGDTNSRLEEIYASLDVRYAQRPGLQTVFELYSSSGKLLLWGPVTGQSATDTVLGIYAPDVCER